MDASDRSKKNQAKGGARPKESSRGYQNFQPNRVFKTPDSDSSDYLDANYKFKDSFENVPNSHNRVEEVGYKSFHKTNRKKRRARSNCDNIPNQSRQMIFHLQKKFSKSNFHKSEENDIVDHPQIISSEVHKDVAGISHESISNNRFLDDALSLTECHSDRDKSLKYFTNPEYITNWKPCTTSDSSDMERESTIDSPDYWMIAKSKFLNKTINSTITTRNSLDYIEPSLKDKSKLKKYRKIRKITRPFVMPDQQTAIGQVMTGHCSSLNSSSPQPSVSNDDILSAHEDTDDMFGAWKSWNLKKQSSISKENRKSLKNFCQFSSSSSEADDEFECDCSFCFSNANNSGPAGIELVRSMLNDRTEINNQLFGEWLDIPPLSPTESAWDTIIQELVEQIRRFNVDVDLFSPCSAMSNSDFEALPTIVPSDPGLHTHQEIMTCTICLSNYEGGEIAKVLPCLHIFHGQCIKLWLAKSSTCPVCRDIVTKKT